MIAFYIRFGFKTVVYFIFTFINFYQNVKFEIDMLRVTEY